MNETLEKVIHNLKRNQRRDITSLAKPKNLNRRDNPKGGRDIISTKFVIERRGLRDPEIVFSVYEDGELIEYEFFCIEDTKQKESLFKTLDRWLNS